MLVIDRHESVDAAGHPTCGGLASRIKGAYFVTVGLNGRATYPRTQRLNLRTPEVRFENWREEFVMVLAHELRHIDQFVLGRFLEGEELEAEVDAETHAATVLEAYRLFQKLPRARKRLDKASTNL